MLAQEKPEASHRDRFAPHAQALQKAEQDLDAKVADHPTGAHLLTDHGLLQLDRNRSDDALADYAEVGRLNQQRRSGSEMPKP